MSLSNLEKLEKASASPAPGMAHMWQGGSTSFLSARLREMPPPPGRSPLISESSRSMSGTQLSGGSPSCGPSNPSPGSGAGGAMGALSEHDEILAELLCSPSLLSSPGLSSSIKQYLDNGGNGTPNWLGRGRAGAGGANGSPAMALASPLGLHQHTAGAMPLGGLQQGQIGGGVPFAGLSGGGMGGGMGGAMGAPLTPLTSLRASLTGGQPAQYAQNVRCAQPYQHQQPTAMAYHPTVQPPSTAGQFSRRTGASWQGVAGARLST